MRVMTITMGGDDSDSDGGDYSSGGGSGGGGPTKGREGEVEEVLVRFYHGFYTRQILYTSHIFKEKK